MLNNDPAALIGIDGHQSAPPLIEEPTLDPALIGIDNTGDPSTNTDKKYVKMVVLDGIVMGPTHCAYDNCQNDLSNHRGGSLCDYHEVELGPQCLVRNCHHNKAENTNECAAHQREWNTYKKFHTGHTQSGICRILQRPGERQPWNHTVRQPNVQRHDDINDDPPPPANYFSPAQYYCVETICAPCGVVIAWTKFDKSESPTRILNFLESVYPEESSRPDYICIDKGCQVLRTAVANKNGERQQDLLLTPTTI